MLKPYPWSATTPFRIGMTPMELVVREGVIGEEFTAAPK